MKIAIAFVLGVSVGVALFAVLRAPSDITNGESAPSAAIAVDEPPSNQALLQRIAELESQVEELEAGRQAAGAVTTPSIDARSQQTEANRAAAATASQRAVQQFMDEGFTAERAEWLQRRYDELVAALSSPEMLEQEPTYLLRKEIGDAEYERYLRATGVDPVVLVIGVLANSQAAVFGFQRNDRITSYDGQRVFDHREIRLMEEQGEVGEPVIVDIIRGGQPMQMYIRRGSFDAGLLPMFPRLPGR